MSPEPNAPPAATPHAQRRVPVGILIALFLLVGIVVAGVRNVPGGTVGVSVNNLSGEVSLADRVGLHFTIPYVVSFYTIDRTTKQLDMIASGALPADNTARPTDDFLNVKAKDGDNVKIDAKVQYNIVAEKAVEVLRTSGSEVLDLMKSSPPKSGDDLLRWKRFERRWIWPVVRAALFDRFNELTREEMNEGALRVEKSNAAKDDANKLLRERFGIEVTLITVENPSSYQEYEVLVRQRKDTDQEVAAILREKEQETAAQREQVERETKAAEVAKSVAKASNERLLEENKADKDKRIRIAEGMRDGVKGKANGDLALNLAVAKGKRRQGEAEAEGVRRLGDALAGARGATLIAAELSKRLKDMTIQASPFLYNAVVQPYLMQQGANVVPNPVNFPQTPAGGNK